MQTRGKGETDLRLEGHMTPSAGQEGCTALPTVPLQHHRSSRAWVLLLWTWVRAWGQIPSAQNQAAVKMQDLCCCGFQAPSAGQFHCLLVKASLASGMGIWGILWPGKGQDVGWERPSLEEEGRPLPTQEQAAQGR